MAGPAAPTRPRARAARDVSTHARTAASRVTSRYVAFGRETQNGGAEGAGFRAGLRERSALIRSALIRSALFLSTRWVSVRVASVWPIARVWGCCRSEPRPQGLSRSVVPRRSLPTQTLLWFSVPAWGYSYFCGVCLLKSSILLKLQASAAFRTFLPFTNVEVLHVWDRIIE